LIGEKAGAVTLSSCTSGPVATPTNPSCPAAFVTRSNPTVCSKGRGPVAICERTTSVNGRDCAGLRLTRSWRVSGSKRQRETMEFEAPGAFGFLAPTDKPARAGSSTSVMVAPPGTSNINSLNSPWAGCTCTWCAPSITPAPGTNKWKISAE
jgi:hypothetical protein